MEPILSVTNLTHRYGERVALDNVSFDVQRGERFGLLGPNGGGKTTLFRILSTLMRPATGTVHLDGKPIDRQRIGVVFQSPSLDKQLTVRENLIHQGHIYGLSGKPLHDRIAELLARFGLSERATDIAGKLSGGLRRRVEIAKGLLHRPELLLLDEPSTGLDPLARREVANHLTELRERDGVTVLLTSHILEEAEECDRLALLDRGHLVALDTPARLKERVGGDVVSIVTREPDHLREKISGKFNVPAKVVGKTVRIERPRGHEFIPVLVEAFPGEIESVSVGKPTLEDVFVHLTGRRLEGEEL